MGSEHYCLRWNNHQSNLLGVFSQLLQDESLVDVTLACSEGAPIRAHKVVLSACSSYFQSLFLDHPERHPIVILKDVRFSELQTLVEFMYKGEVNVQYCQLSALLKTAESLKVKGLAEMTNQNTTLREPEREPDRLRPHSQPSKSSCDSPVDAALTAGGSSSASSANSANATALASSASNIAASTSASASASAAENSIHSNASTATGVHKREPSDRGNSPPPTKRQQTAKDDDEDEDTPLPLDLYQRRIENEEGVSVASTNAKTVIKTEQTRRSATPSVSGSSHAQNNGGAEGRDTPALNSPAEQRPSPCSIGVVEKLEEDDYDEDMDLDDNDDNSSNELGNNFKRRAAAVGLLVSSPLGHSADIDSARSTPISASTSNATGLLPSDLTQRSSLARNANSGTNMSTAMSPNTSSTITASSAVQSDTSGLGPVQSVPLSLKKEIDLSEDDNSNSRHLQPTRSASAGGGLELDYRTTHDSETSDSPLVSGIGAGSGTTSNNATGAGHSSSRQTNAPESSGGNCGGGGVSSGSHKQPQTPPPMYPCVYCNAAFPHQSKLTRHMLSHSLKSLEFRDNPTHALLHPHLLPELNIPSFQQQLAAYQMNAVMSGSSTDLDFAAAVVAAGGCNPLSGFTGCGPGLSGLGDLDCSGVGASNSGSGSGGGSNTGGASCSRSGAGGSSGGGNGSSSSMLLREASSSSTSTSAAAAAAAVVVAAASSSSSLLSSSASDPNSAVLCKFCGKSFPDIPSLISHVPVHTGDRPFKCEYCGKAFKLRHHMKDHCRVHTGERPFRCPMCGKTFSRSTILKAHEKTHFPKYVRKFLPPSPVDTKDELPQ